MDELAKKALARGFSRASRLYAPTLEIRSEVRDMCREDRCRCYGKNWMCPPHCGTLEDNAVLVAGYREGIIVQTTGELDDDFDYDGMLEAEERQRRLFAAFRDELAAEYPGLLPLGNGACKICGSCCCPDFPCRHPDRAISSMEAFGLLVSDVCERNGLAYVYAPRAITFTGCFLLRKG